MPRSASAPESPDLTAESIVPRLAATGLPASDIVPSTARQAPGSGLAALSLAGLFDSAFDFYKEHFSKLALIVIVFLIPIQVAMLAWSAIGLRPMAARVDMNVPNPDYGLVVEVVFGYVLAGSPSDGLPGLITLACAVVASGAAALYVFEALQGRDPSLGSLVSSALRAAPTLLGAATLAALVFGVTALALFALCLIAISILIASLGQAAGKMSDLLSGVVAVGVILAPYLGACAAVAPGFSLLVPLVLIERTPVGRLPGRNLKLCGRQSLVRIWIAVCLLPIIMVGLEALTYVAVESVTQALQLSPFGTELIEMTLSAVLLLFQPYWMVVVALAYVDTRVRREGLDIFAMWEARSALPRTSH